MPALTKPSAPTMLSAPTTALSITTAFMPDHGVAADAAAVQHGAVADMAIDFDHGVVAGKAVHDAGVLQVGALFQHQAAEVAAQEASGPT